MQTQLSKLIRVLTSRQTLPPLLPKHIWQPELSSQISAANDNRLFGDLQLSTSQKLNARAGLLIWNDDIDAAHELVQDGRDATECFWHAIIHRREGDFGNANYWWARTEHHPAFEAVRQAVAHELQNETDAKAQKFLLAIRSQWQPRLFVQMVQDAQNSESDWLLCVQATEMRVLLEWCLGENA